MPKRVSYIFPVSHHFRAPFQDALREKLAAAGVDYRVVYSAPFGQNLLKRDTVDIPWGRKVPLIHVGKALLQVCFGELLRADLIIIQQENRLLFNYFCHLLHMLGLKKVAFFGHGRNMQAERADSRAEKFKRFFATKVCWWFGYTEGTRTYIESLGFPSDRITVFNNAIDTSRLSREFQQVTPDEQAAVRAKYGIAGSNIGLYIGGLYAEKRIDFLIESARLIRNEVPDFQLLVIGGGPDATLVEAAAAECDWIHYTGPVFGKEKSVLASLGRVYLMPGLVGLGILDSFVYKTPIVTTAYRYHSPEVSYLEDQANGVMIADTEDAGAYATAVARVLTDGDYRARLQSGGETALSTYTVENMASRFADGVLKCLSA